MAANLSNSLRERREKLGLTRMDLARLAGCSLTYAQILEAGLTPKYGHVLPRVERVLTALENGDEPTDHAQ